MKKKLIIGLVIMMLLSLSALAAENAVYYADGQFTDVPGTEWYADDVNTAYQLKLMNGTDPNYFTPDGKITVAEAITVAARMHASYEGETIAPAVGEWYSAYVSYAVDEGIITADQFDSYDRNAKRSEIAQLFVQALPNGYYEAINTINSIPDVSIATPYYIYVSTLYKAGVAIGDADANFHPDDDITRAETAAIIARAVFPEKRLPRTILDFEGGENSEEDDAYLLCVMSGFNAQHEGIGSGWLLDNRGAIPRATLTESYGSLTDISTEAGAALIREFNKITKGAITLEAKASADGANGSFLEFQNDTGDSVFRLEIIDGYWKVLGVNGNYTNIYKIGADENMFTFLITVNLNKGMSKIVINNVECGSYPLPVGGAKANILNFRWATTDEGTPSFAPGATKLYANYAVYEMFDLAKDNVLPYGWTQNSNGDAYGKTNTLAVKAGKSATKTFEEVTGTVIAEYQAIFRSKESTGFALKSGNKTVLNFTTGSSGFVANGTNVYSSFYNGQWYMFRFELDTNTQKIKVKVDGRVLGEVNFLNAATGIDSLTVTNSSSREVTFDEFKVFKKIYHSDYVPAPIVPAGDDNYIIGMNHCPLWRNGYQINFSWSVISPYTDYQPAIGYYDEGTPETTDWEIKYLVEHGVDFLSICTFLPVNDTMEKMPFNEYYIFEGLYNAEYIDYIKFCLLLEIANAGAPRTLNDWKNKFVPYLIEKYFKHPSYMTIDNKIVVDFFGGTLGKYAGVSVAQQCMDYLETEVQKLGFDGVYWVHCGLDTAYNSLGYDAAHAYSWGRDGATYNGNVNGMRNYLNNCSSNGQWAIPTISMGFTNTPWNSESTYNPREPFCSASDFQRVCNYVKNTYLPQNATTDTQRKLVWLSTWNEYGEGTLLMPTADEKGFQYLDAVRNTFTTSPQSELSEIDVYPTPAQLDRVTHMYPQYRHLLRRNKALDFVDATSNAQTQSYYLIDFANDSSISASSGWMSGATNVGRNANGAYGTTNVRRGQVNLTINSINSTISSKFSSGGLPTGSIDQIIITAKIPVGANLKIYYATSVSTSLAENKSYTFPTSTVYDYVQYSVSKSDLRNFSGNLTQLRLDPQQDQGTQFFIKSIDFRSSVAGQGQISKTISINGKSATVAYLPQMTDTGDLLVPFEPATGLDFLLNTFHLWDKDNKQLTLNFIGHTMVFTVGSDKCIIDGVETDLGYTIYDKDQLPMVPINLICSVNGYTYNLTSSGGTRRITIVTPAKAYYDQLNQIIANRVPGKWEFDVPGDTESWKSEFMSLNVSDGYMRCQSISSSNLDPMIILPSTSISTSGKTKAEIRVRYKYSASSNHRFQIFYSTANGNWSEANAINIDLPSRDTNDGWVTLSVNVPSSFTSMGTVRALRIDPFNAFGYIDIDYIRIT
ncbi:MAG: S-layer homology domain-containing protein [Clostridiales bacterium]|nr:S-layer homology domain-containing protein [Clostridiales bacterium]